MRVVLLGTGYAIPTAERVHTSILADTADNILLFDCGSGILHRLIQAGYDPADVGAVFFTHHHVDHDADFIALLKTNWMKGRVDMKIFGPMGTEKWLHALFEVYPYLQGRFELDITELEDGDSVTLDRDVIACRRSTHGTDALAYKISSGDASAVYSGDTGPCDAVAELTKGADLLIHECNFLSEDMRDIKGHSNPSSLGKTFGNAGVKKLVLVHLPPEIEEREADVLGALSQYFDGEVIAGKDLMTLEL